MATFTSAFRALAHGTLNWDTQLNADMDSLTSLFETTSVDRTWGGGTYGGDWNNATFPGAYRVYPGNGNQNSPIGAGVYGYGTLIVSTSGQSVTQIYATHSTPRLWYRTKWNTADWTSWGLALNVDYPADTGSGGTANGFTANRFNILRFGRVVTVDFSATRSGGTISSGPTGNITNVVIGNIGNWKPQTAWAPLATGPGGPTCSFAIDRASGNLLLCALPPSYNLTNGQEITCGGSFITDS